MSRWKPNVTVAAVAQRDDRFLMVREHTSEGIRVNQPAGHLEPDESLLEAVVREVREETQFCFEPKALVGIYRWVNHVSNDTFLRFTFFGTCNENASSTSLDEGIIEALWMTLPEIENAQLRSPMILASLHDYLSGNRFPMETLRN